MNPPVGSEALVSEVLTSDVYQALAVAKAAVKSISSQAGKTSQMILGLTNQRN